MSSSDRVQTVRNAWINRVRDEALRMRRPEVSKCFHIGMVIATYTDADGTNAFPSGATIAAIAGCTDETVTRCVKVLVAVGLLERKRRPNKSAVYELRIPLERPDWQAHLHLYTETRQARAKRAAKARELAEILEARNASQDGIRKPFPAGVPETVPDGGSEEPGNRSRTVPETVPGRVPEPVPSGGDQYLPTFGRDPETDHTPPRLSPQPQVDAGARSENDPSPVQPTAARDSPEPEPDFARCTTCDKPMIPDPRRPSRTTHARCTSVAERTAS